MVSAGDSTVNEVPVFSNGPPQSSTYHLIILPEPAIAVSTISPESLGHKLFLLTVISVGATARGLTVTVYEIQSPAHSPLSSILLSLLS